MTKHTYDTPRLAKRAARLSQAGRDLVSRVAPRWAPHSRASRATLREQLLQTLAISSSPDAQQLLTSGILDQLPDTDALVESLTALHAQLRDTLHNTSVETVKLASVVRRASAKALSIDTGFTPPPAEP